MNGRPWSLDEDKILGTAYRLGGATACLPLLPGRTKGAIIARAHQKGILIEGRLPSDEEPLILRNQEEWARLEFQRLEAVAHEAILARDAAWRRLANFRRLRAVPDNRPRRVA